MSYLIFIFYLALFCSILYYYGAQKNTGLSVSVILFLFVLKVLVGCLNLYVHYQEYVSNDIYFYYTQSINELNGFNNHPGAFIKEWLFNWGDFRNGFNLFSKDSMPYWSDIGVLIHTKYMTLANIISFGRLYTNVIFFNIIYFTGLLQLYKVFYKFQPQKKWLFVCSVFLIPSSLFWCSGIHKDGWVLAAIGFVCYYTTKFMQQRKIHYLLPIALSLFLLFVSRYFIFLCFFPPYLIWILFGNSKHKLILFTGAYTFFLLIFFFGSYLKPSFHPMEIVIAKQQAFFQSKGYSDMSTPALENSFSSFLHNLPTAVNHILLQPYFSFSSPIKYQAAAIDAWLVCCMLICCLIFMRRKHLRELFYLMIIFFSVSMYLFIGYTIPNCGALVRYKSEFTVLLLSAMISISEIPFLKRFYSGTILH